MRARCLAFFAAIVALALLSSAAIQQNALQLYQAGVYAEEIEGNLQKAIGIYDQVLRQFPDNRDAAANAQLHIGLCYEKMGLEKAAEAYEKVIKNYPQAAAVAVAQEKLDNILRARTLSKRGERELTIRQIQTPADWEGPGVVSPNGKYLADVDGNTGDLWVRELSTGNQRRLTDEGKDYSQYAFGPKWSPDSARLAFTWVNEKNVAELREIALDGSRPRVLMGAGKWEWAQPQDWSPDGKQVLVTGYVYKERTLGLGLVSVADGSVRTLRTFADRNLAPVDCLFSPDGQVIAYSRPVREGVRERDVFLLSVDGAGESPLIEHPADDELLGWLPEGRGILFASDRAGTIDLWAVQVDKGQPQGAPALVKRGAGPITPMGLTKGGAFYYRTPGSFMDVYTAGLDPKTGKVVGSPKKEPLPYEGHNMMPDWSPDGNRLAYVSRRPGKMKWVLCIYSTDTGKVREFRLDKRYAYPRWSPDGRDLYVQATVADGQGFYRLDVERGDVTPVLAAGEKDYVHDLRVSIDRKWIVYGRDTRTLCQTLRRDAATGQEKELDRTPFDNSTLALSPDGRHLALLLRTEENTRVVKVMGFPDGTPREIQRFKQTGRWIIDIAWSPDGRFVYYSDNATGSTGEWRLWRIPADGGDAQDVGLVTRYHRYISVHPDGSGITFSTVPPNPEPSQVWVMENFLAATRR
jgi:Tol biopolymer transport system component